MKKKNNLQPNELRQLKPKVSKTSLPITTWWGMGGVQSSTFHFYIFNLN